MSAPDRGPQYVLTKCLLLGPCLLAVLMGGIFYASSERAKYPPVPKSSALTLEVCARWKPMVGGTTCRQYVIDSTTPVQTSNLEVETPFVEGRSQVRVVVRYGSPQGLPQDGAGGVYAIRVTKPVTTEKEFSPSVATYEGYLLSGVPVSANYRYDDITVKLTRP